MTQVTGIDEFTYLVSNNAISANSYNDTISYKVPVGTALEIDYIGVIPDLDTSVFPLGSNLDKMEVVIEGTSQEGFTFSVNGLKKNMLPFGGLSSNRPPLKFGEAMTLGSTTIKISEQQTIKTRFWAGSTAVSDTYYVLIHGYLYEDWKVKSMFNADATKFSTLSGGWEQPRPTTTFYCTYAKNTSATSTNSWYDAITLNVLETQQYDIWAAGVQPHANHKDTWFQINDSDYIPKRQPYDTSQNANTLPFDDDAEKAGPHYFKNPIVLNKETFKTRIRDNGTAIPSNGSMVALYAVKHKL